MTKTIMNHCLCAGLGVVFGLSVGTFYWKTNNDVHPLTVATAHSSTDIAIDATEEQSNPTKVYPSDSWSLLQTAFLTVAALENQDYTTLGTLVHKEKGLRLTPYSTVSLENDLIFSCEEIKNLSSDSTQYTWGVSPNTGNSILMPISSYFEEYIHPLSYSKAPYIAIDSVLISGNALENTAEAYPDARFVDFSFRSIDPDLSGHDWSSLKLVFEIWDNDWYLVGIVRSVWTL